MNQGDYIEWVTLRGRGKKPKLTVHLSKEDLYLEEAKRKIQYEQYQEAFMIAETLSEHLQEAFQKWLWSHLGLIQKSTNERKIDVLMYPHYETALVMDPLFILSRHDAHMVQQIFDRLVEYDAVTNRLMPRISHHWESTDGQLWTFYLRKGVKFHNGRELTSADVKTSFERLIRGNVLLQEIVSITASSNTVIQFQLEEVDYLFPRSLSSLKTAIVPIEAMMDGNEVFRKFPIGCGPYQLMQHDDNMVRLDVFSDYYSDRPWLDRIDIIKAPTNYQGDINHSLLRKASNESWKQVRRKEAGASYITFNCRHSEPLQDEHFRKMICERLNPEAMHNEEMGNEVVAYSFCTNNSMQNDLERGKVKGRLLYSGRVLKIAAQQIRAGVNHEKAARGLQHQLAGIGIPATVEVVDVCLFKEPDNIKEYDLFVCGIALSEDQLLSAITSLQSDHLTIYPCLDEMMRGYVDKKVLTIRSLQEESVRWDIFFQIEAYLSAKYAIFFLHHRYHVVNEPKDSTYVNVELDSNGRVDYRKVWKRNRTAEDE